MTIESAKQLFDRLKEDHELRNQLSTAESLDAKWAILSTLGFSFTEEEYEAAKSVLSEDELDRIAGGACSCGNQRADTHIFCGCGGDVFSKT